VTAIPPEAKAACEHYWAYHCYDGLSVRLCQLCHEPDWDDVRAEQRKAATAERDRIRQLATEHHVMYTRSHGDGCPGIRVPFAGLLNTPHDAGPSGSDRHADDLADPGGIWHGPHAPDAKDAP
jgi:hypothetical protein